MQSVVSLQAMEQRGRKRERCGPVLNLEEGEDQQVTGGLGSIESHEGLRGTVMEKWGN